ncbi:hypothetical protein LOTGIDRAFT_160037 [Lottia gigantea]|uniref:SAP domain-containing protein n=1 Tax=Lottia gigantea TaxID=225164 RepID=V4AGN8_LOTGI|nr:hypothetical protein LOTGIDRAFT_160037 [Lottia gigantea]ESO96052.1 hypothetical protein LOTGIDRAFT_160037 [Lottia gigantea]
MASYSHTVDRNSWTVSELKDELRRRRAKTTGRKIDLIERLEAYDRNANFEVGKVDSPDPIVIPFWPDSSPIKAQNLNVKNSKRRVSLDDPRPVKYIRMEGYEDHVRNLVLNYCSNHSKDLTFRFLYNKANLQYAVHDQNIEWTQVSRLLKIMQKRYSWKQCTKVVLKSGLRRGSTD